MRLVSFSSRVVPWWFLFGLAAAVAILSPLVNGTITSAARSQPAAGWGSTAAQVLRYDDAEGYLEFTAQGNRGSHFTVRMDFKGFYVIPQLAMSARKSTTGIPPGFSLPDAYDIIPRDIKVTTDINGTYKHEWTHIGFTNRTTVKHKVDHNFLIHVPPPPEGKLTVQEVLRWHGDVLDPQPKHDPTYQCVIRIADRKPAGGTTTVDVRMSVGLEATYQETYESNMPGSKSPRTSVKEGQYALHFTALGDTRYNAYVNTRSWPSVRYSTSQLEITEPISWQDLRFVVSTSATIPHFGQPSYGTLVSDTDYTVKGTLRIGPTKPLGVYLEPASTDEARWVPEPGKDREYKISVEDENLKDIDAVRATLSDTSAHPGVVTNGGNHVRGDVCDDCQAGKTGNVWRWSGPFRDATGQSVTINRAYRHYNMCPIDTMPDIFFRDADNEGWTFGDDAAKASSQSLRYVAGQQMTREMPIEKETRFKVRVMDGAASAQLSAEVRIAGVWYPVTARGQTADSTGAFLMLPLDANRNELQDAWEQVYSVTSPDNDSGDLPAGAGPGDGLSVFEEYRGVYARGSFRRLWPDAREVFVHDYSGVLGPGLNRAAAIYVGDGIELIELRRDEFKDDVINYMNGSPHKQGSQSIIVVMTLDQVPGVELEFAGGIVPHVGPPTKDANTIIIASSVSSRQWTSGSIATAGALLGHEIGHLMNMPHHGRGEAMRPVEGRNAWVACVNGQHSGDETCLMRYFGAEYVFDGNPVPQVLQPAPLASGQLKAFSATEAAAHFCETSTGSSACKNAAPGSGSCLTKIKVRSY